MESKKSKNKPGIRKGCTSCGGPLNNIREKFTRTCDLCAIEAQEAFGKMGKGQIKEGWQQLAKVKFGGGHTPEAKRLQTYIKNSVDKQRKTLEKRLRKKGLSEEEIKQGLEDFKRVGE